MANFLKKSFVLVLFSLVVSSVANANEYEQVNYLAVEIQSSAGQLFNNTEPYRNTYNFTALVDHSARLQQGATDLAGLVEHETDIYKIEAKLIQLDQCFQQLANLFVSTEYDASQGRGIIEGDTAHIQQLLEQTDRNFYQLSETVSQIRNQIERVYAPGQVGNGGDVFIPIQPPTPNQHFGPSPYNNDFGIQFYSLGNSFGHRPPVHAIQRQFTSHLQFNQQRNFNQQFNQQRLDEQRRRADQQRRQVDQQRRLEDQRRQRLDQQQRQRQADQRRQADQQRRQADQQRQQAEQQRQRQRQADQQRQRQAEQQRQRQRQADQRRQADQQRQRKSKQHNRGN